MATRRARRAKRIAIGGIALLALYGLGMLGHMIVLQHASRLAPPPVHPWPKPSETGQWDRYAGDDGAPQYATLADITSANVDRLEVA